MPLPSSFWQRDFEKHAGLHPLQTIFNRRQQPDHGADLIGRKDDDRECSTGKILLVAQPLICRHEHVGLYFRSPEQLAVLCAGPPHVLNRTNLEMTQPCLNDVGNRLVEEDLQADFASFRRVDLENSRT